MEGEAVVGIDVSKAKLDIALLPGEEVFSREHSPPGVATLVERLKRVAPVLVVFEASGGLETTLVAELGACRGGTVTLSGSSDPFVVNAWTTSSCSARHICAERSRPTRPTTTRSVPQT